MSDDSTQAILAVYLGETYAEVEVRSDRSLLNKKFFLPQISLKTALSQLKKAIEEQKIIITDVYIVCRYFERLKTFRLGGSVIQVVNSGFENSYCVENSSRFSLAASSLVISINKNFTDEFLNTELQRVRKVNPDVNKVVIELPASQKEELAAISDFFKSKDFKVFTCDNPTDMQLVRKTLLNAGSEGTKEEVFSEFRDNFTKAQLNIWVKDKFVNCDDPQFENFDLYFSSHDFLAYQLKRSKKNYLVHLDLENWIILNLETNDTWDSPWGRIARAHNNFTSLSLHPLTEILIDETSRLQFSKVPTNNEPGPMVAGRGVKSLVVDLFYNNLKADPYFVDLFPALSHPTTTAKIEGQFKVLENGQNEDEQKISKSQLESFIVNLIQFEIELNTKSHSLDDKKTLFIGHLIGIINKKNNDFSWTNSIFKELGKK